MLLASLLIVVSLALLFVGAEGLVRGSVRLASRIGISPLIVGLTIVAFGTSSPELVVSTKAALAGQGDIALGNVLGSNIFNIVGILGISGLASPLAVKAIQPTDYLMVILFSLLLFPLLYTGKKLVRMEGGLLLVIYAAYLWMLWP